jgi:hypothetical protein
VLVAVAKIIEERIKIELRPAEYRGWNDDAAGRASEATGAVGRVVERVDAQPSVAQVEQA